MRKCTCSNQLALANHVHDLDPCPPDGSRPEQFETQHWQRQSLNPAVVPHNNIVEIFNLAQFYAGVQVVVVVLDSCSLLKVNIFVNPQTYSGITVSCDGQILSIPRMVRSPRSGTPSFLALSLQERPEAIFRELSTRIGCEGKAWNSIFARAFPHGLRWDDSEFATDDKATDMRER
jgi:hypothetical protein